MSASQRRRVVIVEDEAAVARMVSSALERDGYTTQVAGTSEAALKVIGEFKPDLVVLDLMLPDADGFDLCRRLRRDHTFPIIILTALTDEVDRVAGLEIGADDYVVKPFSVRELIARVRAALRRQEMVAATDKAREFNDGYLVVDLDRPSVSVNGKPVALSPLERRLLGALLTHRGSARTRSQLLEEAWGSADYTDPRTVDVHVQSLRQKLEPDPKDPRYIETVRGIGYRFGK
jgi:two-component system alkaline phosphatase synthesis response regulator PhoP